MARLALGRDQRPQLLARQPTGARRACPCASSATRSNCRGTLSSVIQRVLAPNPGPMTGTGTNTYLVEQRRLRSPSSTPDPTTPRMSRPSCQAAGELGPDHGGAGHAPPRGSSARPRAPVCARTGAPLLGHADLPGVDRALADGRRVSIGLQALTTPGHTRESLCFWDRSEGALFTGDLVAGAGTVIVDDQPGALAHYMGVAGALADA